MHLPTLAVALPALSAFIPAVTADFTFHNWCPYPVSLSHNGSAEIIVPPRRQRNLPFIYSTAYKGLSFRPKSAPPTVNTTFNYWATEPSGLILYNVPTYPDQYGGFENDAVRILPTKANTEAGAGQFCVPAWRNKKEPFHCLYNINGATGVCDDFIDFCHQPVTITIETCKSYEYKPPTPS